MSMFGSIIPATKYASDILFGDTSISADEYTKEARSLLERIVREQGEGPINLKTDTKMLKKYGGGFDGGLDHLLSPYGQLRNTLGAFTVTKNDKGEYVINDTYDWSKDYEDMDDPQDFLNILGKFAYDSGGTKEGEGKPFQMNLGMLTNASSSSIK